MAGHVATVQEIYTAFNKGDVPAILSHLSEEVQWEHESVDHAVPWLKPRRGRSEVAKFFQALAGLEINEFTPRNLLSGGNQVAAVIWLSATIRSTGKRVRDLEVHLWTFDDDGKVSRFRHVLDTHHHVTALYR